MRAHVLSPQLSGPTSRDELCVHLETNLLLEGQKVRIPRVLIASAKKEGIARVSRLCLSTLQLQVNQMSGNRLELKHRGSCAEEWGGS